MAQLKYDLMIEVGAGQVTAGPPIATTLGPKGVPLGLLAKALNESTSTFDKGSAVRARIKIYDDKTYKYDILGNTTRYLIYKAAGLDKGSATPGNSFIGSITAKQAEEIAKYKKVALGCVIGTAKSAGIRVDA